MGLRSEERPQTPPSAFGSARLPRSVAIVAPLSQRVDVLADDQGASTDRLMGVGHVGGTRRGGPWRPGGGLRDGAGATPGCVAASVVDRRRRSPRLGRDRVRDRWRGMAGPREQWREVLLLGGGACGGVGAGDLSPERQERG